MCDSYISYTINPMLYSTPNGASFCQFLYNLWLFAKEKSSKATAKTGNNIMIVSNIFFLFVKRTTLTLSRIKYLALKFLSLHNDNVLYKSNYFFLFNQCTRQLRRSIKWGEDERAPPALIWWE